MPTKSSKASLTRKLLNFAFNTGLIRTGRSLWAKSLTVLNYHRIDDPDQESFDSFKPNVSAQKDDFDRQMAYLSRWFNIVSLRDLINWLDNRQSLPPYAALITFDDGYLDNYTNAYPILKKYNFPAVIFLATNHIDTDTPFYWDLAAYCFHHTRQDHITFSSGKILGWANPMEREQVCKSWIEAMKLLPNSTKSEWISHLPDRLNVAIPKGFFRNLMMNWDQVRDMQNNGIEFGGHTMNHPILSRVPVDEATREIKGSKDRLKQELREDILGFAYPNGMAQDINAEIESIVENAGYKAAFTLINGPSTLQEVNRNRFAIRRIFISHRHTLPHYAVLTSRINRYRN